MALSLKDQKIVKLAVSEFVLPERSMSVRPIVEWKDGGSWFGYEVYGETDPSLVWALSKFEILKRSSRQKPLALDFGGASGYQAMNLARNGFNVVVIDLIDDQRTIKKRNKYLALENKANGKISQYVSDLRDIDSSLLAEICNHRKPSIVSALKLIHFLNTSEVAELLKTVSLSVEPNALLALSYQCILTNTGWAHEVVNHNSEKIENIAKAYGFAKKFQKNATTDPDAETTTFHTQQGFCFRPSASKPAL